MKRIGKRDSVSSNSFIREKVTVASQHNMKKMDIISEIGFIIRGEGKTPLLL
jgi:hypothetical protein